MDIGIIRDPSHTFGMTRNENTSIVIPTERSDEESPKCTAKRDPSHTLGMTRNQNTSIVIPTERSDEESPKCTEKEEIPHIRSG